MNRDYTEWTPRVGDLRVHTDRAAHTGATQTAITRRVLGEILLVIVLGVIKRRGIRNFRRDPAEASVVQPVLKELPRRFGCTLLFRRERVDGGTILRADVVSLDRKSTRLNSSHVEISYA